MKTVTIGGMTIRLPEKAEPAETDGPDTAGPNRIPIKKWRQDQRDGGRHLAAALSAGFGDVDEDAFWPDDPDDLVTPPAED
jgi:hypothetical protein